MRQVVLCGNFGAGNRGDEAILEGMLNLLKKIDSTLFVNVMTANSISTLKLLKKVNVEGTTMPFVPTGIRSILKGLFVNGVYKILKNKLNQSEICILGGGGLLSDERGIKAMWIWFIHALYMKRHAKRLLFIGQSFNQPKSCLGKFFLKKALSLPSQITVRDSNSKNIILSLVPGASVEIGTDMAMIVENDQGCINQSAKSDKLFALNMRFLGKGTLHEKVLVNFTNKLIAEYGYKVVLFGFGSEIIKDSDYMIKLFKDQIDLAKAIVIDEECDNEETLEQLRKCTFAVGMRLHFNIFALRACIPFISLSYDDKVRCFVETIGMKECNLSSDELTFDMLISKFKDIELYREKMLEIISAKRAEYMSTQEVDYKIIARALS